MKDWIKSVLAIIIIIVIVVGFVKFISIFKDRIDTKTKNECIDDCERAGQEFFKIVPRFIQHCICLNKDGDVNEIW